MGYASPLTHVMGYLLVIGIVVLAIAAIATIAYGMRLRSKRRAADVEVRERGEEAGMETHAPSDTFSEPGALDEKTPETVPEPAKTPPARAEVAPSAVPDSAPPAATPPAATPPAAAPPAAAAPAATVPAAAPPVAAPAAASAASPTSDLTQLKGLGPKVATRLAELGVTRIDQLAALSPAEAEALDAQLGTFRGRMARDRWIEQAKLLAAGDRAGFEAAFGKL